MAAAICRDVEVAVLLPSIPSTEGKKDKTRKSQTTNVQELEVTLEQLLPFDFFVVGIALKTKLASTFRMYSQTLRRGQLKATVPSTIFRNLTMKHSSTFWMYSQTLRRTIKTSDTPNTSILMTNANTLVTHTSAWMIGARIGART